MSDSKNFRIILDLSRFFHDHRRIARIFIKNSLKTIQDLENRVSEIFGIQGFYLLTGGQFLPISEDIRVLHNDETVCVTPSESGSKKEYSKVKVSSSTQQKGLENRQKKRSLDDTSEQSIQTSSPRKKKNKKFHISIDNASGNSSNDEEPCKKKKVRENTNRIKCISKNEKSKPENKDIIYNNDQNYSFQTPPKKEKNTVNEEQSIVEKEICNIEAAHKVLEIKRKLKQKSEEYAQKHSNINPINHTDGSSDFKTVLPKLQSHIKNCNNFGRSTLPDTVRLSRHVDTPIKRFTKYSPPQRITDQYLAKTKINIVKIDVIKENTEESSTDDITQVRQENNTQNISDLNNSPPENYVKTVINCFEKNISPNEKTDVAQKELNENHQNDLEQKQNEASNYTKIFLDQKVANELTISEIKADTPGTCNVGSVDIISESNSESGQLKIPLGKLNTLKPLKDLTDLSLDISSIAQDLSSHEISYDSTLNSTNISIESSSNTLLKPKKENADKIYGDVGSLIEHLRASSQESDASSQYVTKRKRIRKRKLKNKKNKRIEEFDLVPIKDLRPEPMINTCPNLHLRFEDNIIDTEVEKIDLIKNNTSENIENEEKHQIDTNQSKIENNTEISSIMEMVVVSDENEDPIMENKSILEEGNISKAPLMKHKLEPKVGDVIAFKILKMSADYNPQVSNYIVGRVEMYLMENKILYFKILSGEEELLPPTGKLSLNPTETEEIQDSKYKEFNWNEMLEPKLLYP